ncbi:B3 domain-containing protein At2g24670-like [Tripterygium wilfordii]|uniref:B3 domain-containing protein At2g24670-like n=1 Tax=Tripterygium wilfordii TaxID=458696 RepID=UPI0018F85C40|nr:B3 domain-containing protein At2g24670-like [Tripterygium wilfordii]
MGRILQIEDLKSIDGGSSEKRQEEAREGDREVEKAAKILTEMAYHSFPRSTRNTKTETVGLQSRKPNIENIIWKKQVTETDLNPHHRRFAMPSGELKTREFLKRKEHTIVDRKPVGGSIEVTLLVLDPVLEEFKVNFKRWKMRNSFTYNLTSGWLKVLDKALLNVDDWVQIWCFQRDSKTCLALVKI